MSTTSERSSGLIYALCLCINKIHVILIRKMLLSNKCVLLYDVYNVLVEPFLFCVVQISSIMLTLHKKRGTFTVYSDTVIMTGMVNKIEDCKYIFPV